MDYQDYYNKAHKASALKDAGDNLGAIAGFEELVNSDISDLDKATMCRNIAIICEQMGALDQSLAWYEEGMRYEAPYMRTQLLEAKAAHLANFHKGRDAEAIAIYEHLYALPYVTENDKERIWKNLTVLRNPRPR